MVNATVTLFKDIGLSPSYNRTIDFTSKTAQKSWFNSISSSRKTVLTDVNYNKIQNSFAVHETFGDVFEYTYVMIENLDNSGRTYYGFVSGTELIDEETTRFDILIDPIQTFMCEWELGESFVVREHLDRWDSGTSPINVKPSEIKASTFLNVEKNNVIIPNDNLRVVIIAFSSDDYIRTGSSEATLSDNIFYAYAIVDISDFSKRLATLRPGRRVTAITETSTDYYCDVIYMPSFGEIIDGSIFNFLNITPASIVSISLLPYCNIISESVPSNVDVTFPQFIAAYGTSADEFRIIDGETVNISVRNNINESTIYYIGTYPIYQRATSYLSDTTWGLYNLCPYYGGTVHANSQPSEDTFALPLLTVQQITELQDTEYSISFDQPVKPTNGATASDTYEPSMFMAPFRNYSVVDYKGNLIGEFPDFIIAKTPSTESLRLRIKTVFDVSGASNQLLLKGSDNKTIIECGAEGNNVFFRTDGLPFVNDTWLNYKLTSLDSDRSNAKLQAIAGIITGGIYGAYGGALVGSRSASGDWDSDERRNTLLKRGAIGAGIVGGVASIGASAVNAYVGLQEQKNKENSVKNQSSEVVSTTDPSSYIRDGISLSVVSLKCDDVNYEMGYSTLKYYGQDISTFKTPNIRSRKYYNYIITQGCTIDGALNADIKNEIAKIFDTGITIFHGDYCTEPDYPTNSSGEELENIERTLI